MTIPEYADIDRLVVLWRTVPPTGLMFWVLRPNGNSRGVLTNPWNPNFGEVARLLQAEGIEWLTEDDVRTAHHRLVAQDHYIIGVFGDRRVPLPYPPPMEMVGPGLEALGVPEVIWMPTTIRWRLYRIGSHAWYTTEGVG